MARGKSLHIGVNEVDPAHYEGWKGRLLACEADAKDMLGLAGAAGFEGRTLLTAEATRDAVLAAVRQAAKALVAGDIFFLSYSGHGGQIGDLDGDEADRKDETWCLYDGEVLDDELWEAWHGFAEGVRVLVLSDSCHSGTVVRAPLSARELAELRSHLAATAGSDGELRYRFMPEEVAQRTHRAHRAFYRDLTRSLPEKPSEVLASVKLISGCQDDQFSLDGTSNGLFTGTLKQVWQDGGFEGSYLDLYREIVERMPASQTPNYLTVGRQDRTFDAQRPFSIDPTPNA